MICHNDRYFARFLGKYSSGSWIHCFHLFAYEFMMEIPIHSQNAEQPMTFSGSPEPREKASEHFAHNWSILHCNTAFKKTLRLKTVIRRCEMMHSCGPTGQARDSYARGGVGKRNRGCREKRECAGRDHQQTEDAVL